MDSVLHEWVVNDYYPRFVREYGPTLEDDVAEFRARRDRVNRLNIKLNHVWARLVLYPNFRR